MARAAETRWEGPLSGLAVTRYGHAVACGRVAVVEAAHPHADAAGEAAARRALALVDTLGPGDMLLALASGGGSALLSLPAPGLASAEKRTVVSKLFACGAPIGDINRVRRHLSAIKGGRLAAAAAARGARVHTIVVSDVPGDDPAAVASGPTVADTSTPADAVAVLERWNIAVPRVLADTSPAPACVGEVVVAATAMTALTAAANVGRHAGWPVTIVSDRVEGEARTVGRADAVRARAITGPAILLSGGETTVTVTGVGRGGRNLEYLAGLALGLDGAPAVYALAADTDGIDGTGDAAGGFVDPTTLDRARALGLDAAALLADNDADRLFAALGDLVVTGPTRTNVNDLRAILVAPLHS